MGEGIQYFEKIRLLKEEFTKNNNTAALNKLNQLLEPCDVQALKTTPAATILQVAKQGLKEL